MTTIRAQVVEAMRRRQREGFEDAAESALDAALEAISHICPSCSPFSSISDLLAVLRDEGK